ncbi:MAG TPA: adenylate/guanylate cyclase domain-containing protein [Gemmatimonadota bacterium]|nr:adenylate/guanylate cyclase domain-containing protein [Gemmatimonadota bacterium]
MTRIAHHLAAIWFADIVGYTTLSSRNEDEAVRLVDRLQAIARQKVEGHGGRVVKFAGDAVLAAFPSTDEAVRAALEVQEQFAGAGTAGSDGPSLRIGIHVGDVVASADGDLYGDGVNVASRVQGLTDPGEVWVSEDVWRQLRQRPGFRFETRGERRLKGLAAPLEVYGVRLETQAPVRGTEASAHRHIATPESAAPPAQSIAVLPFANLSADPDNEYFSDGITEEILTVLAPVEGLKVISRTSVMQYKGTTKSVRQIGQELDVATVLEGSVRRAGDRVRIAAQLIDAVTDKHLWADRYDRNLEDIFAIQTDVAERIVEALRVRLSPREKARIAEQPTENVEAYQWFLKGRYFLAKRTEEALRQAIDQFRQAVKADPSFAQAWAGLAGGYALLPSYSNAPAAEASAEARSAAEHALALDPGLGEPHAALGMVAQLFWEWDEADREYRRAIELSPGYATAHHWYGGFLSSLNRHDEAIAEFLTALELDPLSLPVLNGFAMACLFAGRFDEAILTLRKVLEMDPGYFIGHLNLAETYDALHRYEDALEEWEAIGRIRPERIPPDLVAELRSGYETAGGRGYWEAWVAALRSREGFRHRSFYMAIASANLGRLDEAFAWLDRLVTKRRPIAPQISAHPSFEALRSDPRYEELLRRINLA